MVLMAQLLLPQLATYMIHQVISVKMLNFSRVLLNRNILKVLEFLTNQLEPLIDQIRGTVSSKQDSKTE